MPMIENNHMRISRNLYYSYQPGISGPTRRHHSSLEVWTMRIFNINRIKSSNSLVKREACTSRTKVGCSFSLWNLHQVHFRNCRTAGATRIKMETCWRRLWIAATSRFLCLQSLQLSNTGKFWTIIKQAVLAISPIFICKIPIFSPIFQSNCWLSDF